MPVDVPKCVICGNRADHILSVVINAGGYVRLDLALCEADLRKKRMLNPRAVRRFYFTYSPSWVRLDDAHGSAASVSGDRT